MKRIARLVVGAARVVVPILFVTSAVAADTPPAPPMIPNARTPLDGVLTGGQPTFPQLERAAQEGWRTVINLRTEGEPGFEWERAAAERLGMSYIQIPIAGAADLTRANVERLDTTLRDARPAGRVLLHCASGNRAGALLALRENWLHGAAPEDALALGLAAGLTSLEPQTRRLLGLESRPDQRDER
jgi:uncharacterized protein (TIGR01244 family)